MNADTRLYDALGVAPSAAPDVIKRAYRSLARDFHPDRNPDDPDAERRFKEVSAAYEVLSDPQKRALYDEFGMESTKLGFDPDSARHAHQWSDSFGHGPGGFADNDMGDLLEQLFGSRGPRGGADVQAELQTDFHTAIEGGERDLTFGDGRTLRVRLPPGVRDGETLRLRGKGQPGTNGAVSGDLLVTVRVAPHPQFQRDGEDLEVELPVTLGEALLGLPVQVPTLGDPVKLQVPPNSQPGQRLRLRGKGVRRGSRVGDLIVRLRVVLPDASRPEVRDAVAALEETYERDVRAA